MSLFDKYCRGKDVDARPTPVESQLPNQFDAGRRRSVSAECWTQTYDSFQCSQSARLPPRCGSRAAVAMASPAKRNYDHEDSPDDSDEGPGGTATSVASANASNPYTHFAESGPSAGSPEDDTANEPFPPEDASPEVKQTYSRIAAALRNTIFFKELSDDLMRQVLRALQRREVQAGVAVIEQGDEGNELYVLDEGRVEFIRDGKSVGEASSGSTFGELALLYNSVRAATVKTLEPCVVYSLDRIMFKRIMVAKLSRKRVHSQQVLASIDVFAGLPEATQLKIADALHPTTFHKGDVVIKQGDRGYDFYLIDEGAVDVSVDGKVVGTLGSGSYFGEIALINDLPRAATVTVSSGHLKVEALSSAGFEQLIGPELVAELRKRDPRRSS